jgi:hypothetical protein
MRVAPLEEREVLAADGDGDWWSLQAKKERGKGVNCRDGSVIQVHDP